MAAAGPGPTVEQRVCRSSECSGHGSQTGSSSSTRESLLPLLVGVEPTIPQGFVPANLPGPPASLPSTIQGPQGGKLRTVPLTVWVVESAAC